MNTIVEEIAIKNIMAAAWQIEPEEVPCDVEFNEFAQWDSMGHVSLLLELEKNYGVSIDYQMLTELTSMAAIIEYLKENSNAG